METKLISVVVVAHNRPDSLKEALESVENQTYSLIQLIIVENDASLEVADLVNQFLTRTSLSDTKVVETSSFVNGSVARNLGIKAARGEWIAFLDDDDYWDNQKLAKQYEIAMASNAGVIYTGLVRQHGNEYLLSKVDFAITGDVHETIFSHIPTVTSALLIDKKLLDENQFDETMTHWQEYELLVRLSEKTEFAAVDDYLTTIRDNFTSKSRMSNQVKRWLLAVQKFKNKYSDRLSLLPNSIRNQFELQLLKDKIQRVENASFKQWLFSRKDVYKLIRLSKNYHYLILFLPVVRFRTLQKIRSKRY